MSAAFRFRPMLGRMPPDDVAGPRLLRNILRRRHAQEFPSAMGRTCALMPWEGARLWFGAVWERATAAARNALTRAPPAAFGQTQC